MTMQERDLDRYGAALMNTFGAPRLVLARGEGAYVWDVDGNRYLDLLGGIAVNALGHGHPALVEAVTTQLSTLGHISNFFTSEPQIALAERLVAMVGGDARVFLANSGTEANEAALKLTRLTGRTRIVAMEGAFHGRTFGALALTAKEAYRAPFEPLPGHVTFVPYGDETALRAAVDETVAAVVLEPIQGEAGVVIPPPGYLAAAREITGKAGALLWFDEVQTGIGRTGAWLAYSGSGVTPDVVTLAKGLGGGIPIGACIGIGRAAGLFAPGNHGTTFGGNPVASAAALAVLDAIEGQGLMSNARAVGEQLVDGLAHSRVTEIRGRGLLVGLDLDEPVAGAVARVALGHGYVVNDCTPSRIRLAPPLILSREQATEFLAAWPRIVDEAYEEAS
jgi:acetylornithine aminotransferase